MQNQKILLVDVDSKIPNIALMKLSSFYKKQGMVDLYKCNYDYYPKKRKIITINAEKYDKVFVAILFTTNKNYIKIINCKNVIYGGTGFDIKSTLPEDIEKEELDYSLYPNNDTSYGFITRGCIRNCPFCFVPKKEGQLKEYNKWKNIVKHKKVKFLDNNFLAYNKHKEILKELRDNKILFQFNQGLDLRLIDDENAKLLSECKYLGEYIFAFDDVSLKNIIETKIKLLKKYIKKDWRIKLFIYCHPNMAIQNDVLYRINWCKKQKIYPYLMRDVTCWESENKHFYIDLAAWCNQPGLFKLFDFKTFTNKRHLNKTRAQNSIKIFYDLK